jgi:hypothetical protein
VLASLPEEGRAAIMHSATTGESLSIFGNDAAFARYGLSPAQGNALLALARQHGGG